MDWRTLERMIKEERRAGNPVAGLIHSLQLESNAITLLLTNELDGDDEAALDAANAAATAPAARVQVDLSLSAYANARSHHDTRKKQVVKQAKTVAANELAMRAAEKKALAQLQKARGRRLRLP